MVQQALPYRRSQGTKTMMPITFAKCHPERKHYGRGHCRSCYDKWRHSTTYNEQRRGKRRAESLKYRYGITIAEFDKLFKAQEGLCRICSKPKKLFVDHDHETKQIRGLLCSMCNTFLGFFEKYARQAYEYLDA